MIITDTEKLVNILNTYNNNDWRMNAYRNKIFEQYIKDFMKQLNADCKKAGWKQKGNLVKYENYIGGNKVFCLVSPQSRILLKLGKFDLLKYIEQFEENKEMIRAEALKFVKETPGLFKKFDPLIKEYIDFMKKRPAYIEKSKIKIFKKVKGSEIEVIIKYGDIANSIVFNIYKGVEYYPLSKICRAQSNGIVSSVVYDIFQHMMGYSGRKSSSITQKEQDFVVKNVIKTQDIRIANELIADAKLSQDNIEKLNGLLMVDKMNGGSFYTEW